MTATAKLFTTGGSQAVRLPKEFRFPGKTVTLRRTKKGVLITPAEKDHAALRAKLLRLAGSCPDFPLREPFTAPDVPRDLTW
jgi:antitoxin VapB